MPVVAAAVLATVFVLIPVLALVSCVQLYLLLRFVRREHPDLIERFSGYGSHPQAVRANFVRFLFGGHYLELGGELARRARRTVAWSWTTVGLLGSSTLLGFALFD